MNMDPRLIACVHSREVREGLLVVLSQLIKGLQLHQEHHLWGCIRDRLFIYLSEVVSLQLTTLTDHAWPERGFGQEDMVCSVLGHGIQIC
jgi:hypothetical protein